MIIIKLNFNLVEDCVDCVDVIVDFVKDYFFEDNMCLVFYDEVDKFVSGLGLLF